MKIEQSALRKIIVYSVSESLCYSCGFHETQCLLSGRGGIVKNILIPPKLYNTVEEKEGYMEYTSLIQDKKWLESLNGDLIIGGLHTHPQDDITIEEEDLTSIAEAEKLWGHPCEDLIVGIPSSIASEYIERFKNRRFFRGPLKLWLNLKDIELKRKYLMICIKEFDKTNRVVYVPIFLMALCNQ